MMESLLLISISGLCLPINRAIEVVAAGTRIVFGYQLSVVSRLSLA